MQEVLDTHTLEVDSRADARKERIEADAAWELISSADSIVVAKGKKVETHVPSEDVREAILKVVLGRSGSLRAPTVQVGKVFYVGYNDALYADAPFING